MLGLLILAYWFRITNKWIGQKKPYALKDGVMYKFNQNNKLHMCVTIEET
jgi:hypothetical protein